MLQGSLENFALDEVLGLLASTSKTGQLEIAGNRGTGALMFNGGRLVDGTASYTANGAGLEDVMFELLRYGDGTFTFASKEIEPTDNPENLAGVLSSAENRLRDWRSIEAIVPTLNHQVTPSAELPADEVTITRTEWAALTVIAAGCPVSLVCDRLNLGEVEGSRQIKNLAERELVSVTEPIGGYGAVRSATAAAKTGGSNGSTIGSSNGSSNTNGSALSDVVEAADAVVVNEPSDSGLLTAERPPMPPAPATDEFSPGSMAKPGPPPAPPSPAELGGFGDGLNLDEDEEAKGGGLLARYRKGDD